MQRLRLYDPDRERPDWTSLIGPGQFAAFSKHATTGAACDDRGQPFSSPAEADCLCFDSLGAAKAYCEARVAEVPDVRFDVYDSAGRVKPPLLTIVNRSREHTLTANPRAMRRRTIGAILLFALALPLLWFDYQRRGLLVLPTVLAINMILLAARLLHMNYTIQELERARSARVKGSGVAAP